MLSVGLASQMKGPEERSTPAALSVHVMRCVMLGTRYLAVGGTRLTPVSSTHTCGVEIRNLSLLDLTAVSAV
jgi:hypothetical protein